MNYTKIFKTVIIAVFIAVAFIIGTYTVNERAIKNNSYDTGYNMGYEAAWNEAKTIVDSSTMFPREPEEMYLISGIIKDISISNGLILLEANPVSSNPLSEDSKSTVRKIKINSDTEIIEIIYKTPEEMLETEKNEEASDLIMPFSPFTENKITLKQLNIGDRITITSDKNIKKEMEIMATKISLTAM